MPGPLAHLSLHVMRPRILSVLSTWTTCYELYIQSVCVLPHSQLTPHFYNTVEVEDNMVGGVLHAHDTKAIDVASQETSGDSVNIENIHMLLLFVETQFIEWMAPFCIALVAETQFWGHMLMD